LLHVVNHSLYKGLLFLGAGAVYHATGTRDLDRLGGLMKRMPWTASAFLVGATAIVGLPPLNGFASEFLLYSASFGAQGLLSAPPTSVVALGAIGTLALVGGLAAFCFAMAFGITFLGEPRSQQAAEAHAPGFRMVLPIVLLAAGCIGVGMFSSTVVAKLLPVVAQLTSAPPEDIATQADAALAPLERVAQISCGLLALAAALAVVRWLLLAGREVTASSTWGCGYAAGTPRIQYTASSFARPALEFFTPLVRTRMFLAPPSGLFPRSAELTTDTFDLSTNFIYRPMFGSIGWTVSKLRWLQQGRVHLYVLYLGCTMLALLIWYTVYELPPQDSADQAAAVRQSHDTPVPITSGP
jgi:NADH:ubiquinone oxidoreductase subunit 5 (subunit L)/multisubunit Na+/H+ antiporter MnhA subunit